MDHDCYGLLSPTFCGGWHRILHVYTLLPGHVGVVSDPGVAEQIGLLLWHQDSDLFQRAAQF